MTQKLPQIIFSDPKTKVFAKKPTFQENHSVDFKPWWYFGEFEVDTPMSGVISETQSISTWKLSYFGSPLILCSKVKLSFTEMVSWHICVVKCCMTAFVENHDFSVQKLLKIVAWVFWRVFLRSSLDKMSFSVQNNNFRTKNTRNHRFWWKLTWGWFD